MLCFRDTALGRMGIEEKDGFITYIHLPGQCKADSEGPETPLLGKAFTQLEEYFAGRRRTFDLPLKPEGTPFMKQVWRALCTVPYAHTASYKDIAEAIGNPKACRAVGMANNRNPISIVIPCHRIVGSNGALVGYGGGLDLKERLLGLERMYGPAD
ncbi:methylated-DNA--[protein]-cysteine S-methyltransferase [uncultured Bilophila sp.]|uniref:methylated-DNA--[protein]-cysteine S-methyltransferase n=1 Tax=uncultured Bilophila sp. TaxID=529385 RepID=UPI00280A87BA|nr:methylated-DNA--[protein]-cysteine S-methyltransferase [uncultured Bilophila sp.]